MTHRFPHAPGARTLRLAAATLATLATAMLAACGAKGGRSDYAQPDTGAASPASTPTVDASQAPDSTAGVSDRSGKRGVSGDTLTARPNTPGRQQTEGKSRP